MRSRTGTSGRYSALGSAVAIAHLVTKILPPGSHQVRAESTSPVRPSWLPPPAGGFRHSDFCANPPPPARYCVGDVAGEHRLRAGPLVRGARHEQGRASRRTPAAGREHMRPRDRMDRGPEPRRRAHGGVIESWRQWLENFDEWGYELEEVRDCGDRVLATIREEGRGSASGATVSARNYIVMTFRDGKILRYQEFYDQGMALEAAGLRE